MSENRPAHNAERARAVRELYDREAGRYDRMQQGRFSRWLLRNAREKAAGLVQGHVLEVGIGTGLSLPHYPAEIRVTGIDLSPEMLKLARGRLDALGRDDQLLQMDAQVLDFPDHHFDSVAFNLCLCSIPDPVQALREAVRVVRSLSPMVFLEHVRSNLVPVAFIEDLLNPLTLRFAQDRANLRTEELIRGAGIEVLSVARWALGVMTLIVGRSPCRSGRRPFV